MKGTDSPSQGLPSWPKNSDREEPLHVSSWTCICPVSTLVTPEADTTALPSRTNESTPRRIRLASSSPAGPGAPGARAYYRSRTGGSYSSSRSCSTPATTLPSSSSSPLTSLGWCWFRFWSMNTWSIFPLEKFTITSRTAVKASAAVCLRVGCQQLARLVTFAAYSSRCC